MAVQDAAAVRRLQTGRQSVLVPHLEHAMHTGSEKVAREDEHTLSRLAERSRQVGHDG